MPACMRALAKTRWSGRAPSREHGCRQRKARGGNSFCLVAEFFTAAVEDSHRVVVMKKSLQQTVGGSLGKIF